MVLIYFFVAPGLCVVILVIKFNHFALNHFAKNLFLLIILLFNRSAKNFFQISSHAHEPWSFFNNPFIEFIV